jgi:hypothetical protein
MMHKGDNIRVKGIVIAIASILILSTAVMSVSADTAMIWTDKDDYSPGETVTIYGSGFNANAEITITIVQPNGTVDTITANSDENGSFTAYYDIDNDDPVGTYTVTATDGTNTAYTTFTDAPPAQSPGINMRCTPNPVTLGNSVECKATGLGNNASVRFEWYDASNTLQRNQSYTCTGTCTDTFTPNSTGTWTVKLKDSNNNELATATFQVNASTATATVIFKQVGIDSDFTGVVLTVDDTDYYVGDLPVSITKNVGETISFTYHSPLTVDGKRYVLTSTSGLSTQLSGTITVPSGGGEVTGNYKTQYKVSFTQEGSDLAPTVSYSINDSSSTTGTVPFDVWVDAGSNISYTYQDIVMNDSNSGIRYVLTNVNPPSPQTVNEPLTITGYYAEEKWKIIGFYQPVDMPNTVNVAKAGSTIPLKFEVFWARGDVLMEEITDTNIIKQPLEAQRISNDKCNGLAPDTIDLTATGGTSLRYDPIEGQFIYNWKTPSYKNTCWQVTVSTIDGSSIYAYFKLK